MEELDVLGTVDMLFYRGVSSRKFFGARQVYRLSFVFKHTLLPVILVTIARLS
jgi:hypothetical protein